MAGFSFAVRFGWANSVFEYTGPEICGQEWGRLYRMYHTNPYSKAAMNERLKQLLDDHQVSNSRGVIEYILGGERDASLLHIRVFDKKTAKVVYQRQT